MILRPSIHLLLLATSILLPLPAPAAPRPNILYLYVDDMGWGSIGPNGQAARRANGDPHVLTPNLDALAAAGINFQRAYGCTVCSPARSSQQTGFHQGHTYADRNNTDNARKAMRADDITMGKALSAAGYTTGYWGKWGYGAEQSQNNPAILNLQTLPTSHGYDYVLAELHHVRAHTFFQPTLWSAPAALGSLGGLELVPNSMATYANNAAYPETPALQSDPTYPATGYCDDAYSFAALDFVRTQGQNYNTTGQPFFGLLAVQVPHSPYDEINQLPDWNGAYSGNTPFSTLSAQAQQWAAMVTRIDAHFGNILAALEDPNNDGDTADSIADNTLVIFMSDNGGPNNNARAEIDANGGLRGSKGSIWEGGIRVPCIMRWPTKITSTSTLQAGTNTDLLLDVSDLLPTFCELAGTGRPLGVDGVSLAPTITGTGEQRHRPFLIHEAQPDKSIIRGDFKLVDDNSSLKLYNLVTHPDESSNIAGSNAALVTELNALLVGERTAEAAWFANTYHHWTGADGAPTNNAANWSDYAYTNALNSQTYMSDNGAPRSSWTARMENTGPAPNTATADADLDLLALEIEGASPTATQTLDLGSHTLTGRNEIRLSAHSRLLLDNGTLNSLRWLELADTASLSGAGKIDTTVYQSGTIAIIKSAGTPVPGDGAELIDNGGFENGTPTGDGDYSFATIDDWTTEATLDQTTDAAKDAGGYNSTYRGLIHGTPSGSDNIPVIQDTGIPILLGDTYTLDFWTIGKGSWEKGVDLIRVRLFYEIDGVRTDIFSTTVPGNTAWTRSTFSVPAVTDADAVGHSLHLILAPEQDAENSNTEWASIDDVSLTRDSAATVIPCNNSIDITGDYFEFPGSTLALTLGDGAHTSLTVTGSATLTGSLDITLEPGFTPGHGDSFPVLTATSLSGTFDHADDCVTSGSGHAFSISYSATTVTLTATDLTTGGTPYDWLEDEGLVTPGSPDSAYEAAATSDTDYDGFTAAEEYIAGTNPNDAASAFRPSITPDTGTNYDLAWTSAEGRNYTILSSPDLVSAFTHYSGPHSATPPTNSVPIPSDTEDRRFFKVMVEITP